MRTIALLLVGTLACGGQDGDASAAEEATSGQEVATPEPQPQPAPEPEPAPEPAPELEPQGPGSLRVTNTVGGQAVAGTVQVLDEAGEVVAEGESGETFEIPSGIYLVVGTITDRSVMLDTPTTRPETPVRVTPGELAEAFVAHPRSLVRIRVLRGNRPVRRWRLELTRRGSEQTITLEPSDDYAPLTPGRYSGTVHVGTSRIEVEDIVLQADARRDLPIRIQ